MEVETHNIPSFDLRPRQGLPFARTVPMDSPAFHSPAVLTSEMSPSQENEISGSPTASVPELPCAYSPEIGGGDKTDPVEPSTAAVGKRFGAIEASSSNAALRVQKVYRSYRTRRRLADTAVVAEELWWRAIDFVRLNQSTISFFDFEKPEPAPSRWNRIVLNASKVGKGLLKDSKAQKLAFQHWIEAIDPRHRYGHNLHKYYDAWCKADSGQPFFYWLDIGDGKDLDLKDCPRSKLRQQCIKYLGPQEREHYEYVVVEGKIIHKETGCLLDTNKGSQRVKWIFVMSTSKKLYAGEKKKGIFHHSSFLAGGATLAAGRLVAVDGILVSISPYSGHYRPNKETLDSLFAVLGKNGVNLDEVQKHSADEDYDYYDDGSCVAGEASTQSEAAAVEENSSSSEPAETVPSKAESSYGRSLSGGLLSPKTEVPKTALLQRINSKKAVSSYQLGHQLSRKWSTGAGPRIGCIADYPEELRNQALEFVNLSPRAQPTPKASIQATGLASPTTAHHPASECFNGDAAAVF